MLLAKRWSHHAGKRHTVLPEGYGTTGVWVHNVREGTPPPQVEIARGAVNGVEFEVGKGFG